MRTLIPSLYHSYLVLLRSLKHILGDPNLLHALLNKSSGGVSKILWGCILIFFCTFSTNSLSGQTPTCSFTSVVDNSGISTTDALICAGGMVTLTGSGSGIGTGLIFAWDSNPTSSTVSGNTNNILTDNPLVTTTYTVTVTGSTGSCASTRQIIVNPAPTLLITDPDPVCSPSTVDITDAAVTAGSGTGTLTYYLDAALTTPYTTPTAATAGMYYIRLEDTNGCVSSGAVTVTVNSLPTLTITNPGAVCSPSTVDITDAAVTAGSSTGTLTYYLDAALTTLYTTPTAATAGTYYIRLQDANGCGNSGPVTVSINSISNLNITGPATACNGSTVTIDAGAGYSSYNWSQSGTTQTILVAPGTYTVTVSDANGCTATDTYTVSPTSSALNPVVTDAPVCIGSNGTLTVTGVPTTGITYLWSDAAGSTTASITAPAGTYSVTVTDGSNCQAVATGMVIEAPNPNATLGNIQICTGTTTTLDAGPGTGYTYAWSTSAITQTISNVGPGTYTVTVTGGGCTSIGTAIVSAVTNPNIPITATSTVLCTSPASTSTLTISGTGSWTGPGGFTATGSSITISTPGTYTVMDASNCNASGTIAIADGQPSTILAVNANPICAGNTATFTLGGGGSGAMYQLFVNGVASGSATATPSWSMNTLTGGEVIHVQTTNSFGCIGNSNMITMTVEPFNPILVASPSNTVCTGTSVTYLANGGGTGGTYEFFINGISQGVQSTNFLSPTSVNNGDVITVNVSNLNGCSGFALPNPITMTVTGGTSTSLTSSATNNAICINELVTFTATGGGTGALYEFFKYVNGVPTSIQGPSTTATYNTTGLADQDTVYVTVTTSGAGSCNANSTQIVTSVRDVIPTLTTSTGATTFCQGDIVTFIAGGGVTFEYFVNNVSQGVSGLNSFTTNTLTNNDIVKVRVGSATGCLDSMMQTIAITAAPTIAISPLTTSICAGTPVTYTASGGSNYDFFINGVLQTTTGNTFTTSTLVNGDVVSVSGSNTGTCSRLATAQPVTVTSSTSAGVISGKNSLCQGSVVQLTNNSSITTGTWLSSNNSIATVASNGAVTAVAPGTANITYTISSGNCTSTSAAFPVFVSATGSLTIGSSVSGNVICAGDAVTLSTTAGAGVTYIWTASTGGTLPNTASITVSPTTTTTYTLTSSGGSCSGTSSITITVNNAMAAGAITGGAAGGTNLCEGAALALSPSISGGGTVIWSSSNPSIVNVNASTGVVTASNVLTSLPASATISYTVTQNGCTAISPPYQVTVIDCTGSPGGTAVCISAKALLEGPFDASTQLMNDALRTLPTATTTTLPSQTVISSPFPFTEPYTALPNFTHVGGGGGETTTAAVLGVSGSDAIVDWVFLELRDATNPANVLVTKSALMQRDGDIVDAADGTSPVCITAGNNNYHIAVRHRNHLGIMTDDPVALTAGTSTTVDMSTTVTTTTGYAAIEPTHPVDTMGNRVVMWGGDANSDGQTIFTGPTNDRDAVFFDIFLDPANTTASYNHIRPGYYNGDTNLDGEVKYQGPTNDLDRLMFFNVLFYPNSIGVTQIISQQLP